MQKHSNVSNSLSVSKKKRDGLCHLSRELVARLSKHDELTKDGCRGQLLGRARTKGFLHTHLGILSERSIAFALEQSTVVEWP